MSKGVDLELRNAFVQLQAKMVESSQKIQVIDSQMQRLSRVKLHVEITEGEIGALAKQTTPTRTYESVGRMFVLTDLPDVLQLLRSRHQEAHTKIQDLENNKTYLEKSIKESEDNLREMIQQRKDQPT